MRWFSSIYRCSVASLVVLVFACAADKGYQDPGRDDVGNDATEDVVVDVPGMPGGCSDEDGDQSPGTGDCEALGEQVDCDDGNPNVFVGALEICNGIDDDCDGETDETLQNACGGCGELEPPLGQVCGDCGQVICDPTDPSSTACDEGAGNICGGCERLEPVPGTACGECGEFVCAGDNITSCLDPGLNTCGGCAVLDDEPGNPCGACGMWACAEDGESLTCDDPGLNACGGCESLFREPGEDCGPCKTWECNGPNDVSCEGPDERRYYYDFDNDLYGVDNDWQDLCEPTGFYTATQDGDCDDDDAGVYPGQPELCNGKDDNCVGGTDENDGDCIGNDYCLNAACWAPPTITFITPEPGGCIDLSEDNHAPDPAYRRIITGRAGADFVQRNSHVSCGLPFEDEPDPPIPSTLDGAGNFTDSFETSALESCNDTFYGEWEIVVVVDGVTSTPTRVTYYNGNCPGPLRTCSNAANVCNN